MIHRLFVYGTLRSEYSILSEMIGKDRYRVVGKGVIKGKRLSGTVYPAVVPTTEEEWIEGELMEIIDFTEVITVIDDYEAFYPEDIPNSLYVRSIVEVYLEDGSRVNAWVYFYKS
jgi:gamma-glutamylcyclotransferase (GGCT)/AIG2-like uncharacterized protein YtfP